MLTYMYVHIWTKTLFGLHLDKNQRLNMPNPIVQVIEPIVEETLLSN